MTHHDPTAAWLLRVDPRARIVAAVVLSLIVALAQNLTALAVGLAVAAVAVPLAGIRPALCLRRLLPLNAVMFMLWLVLPWSTPGEPLGWVGVTHEGVRLAAAVTLKGNAVVLLLLALVGTLDGVALGHALSHLHVPRKLTQVLLLTVRYVDVLHAEYLRLRAAMRVRGFRPRMDRHTCRSLGYLAGMVLVRSVYRSERIFAAMKCRGYDGQLWMLDHFHFSWRDLPFALAAAAAAAAMLAIEWQV